MATRIDLAEIARRQGVRPRRSALRPIEPPRRAETDYRKALFAMLREAAKLTREHILPKALSTKRSLTQDSPEDLLGGLGVLREALEFRLRRSAEDMVGRVLELENRRHTSRFAESIRAALGIDLSSVLSEGDLSDEMAIALRRNASLIKGLADETLKRVEGAATDAVVKGRSQKDLAKRLTNEFGVMRSRARLIARDQTAKLTSDLNRLRQTQVGVSRYIWRTSRDERVRPSHREKEGNEYRWDRPPADTGHPGEDVQCRCTAEAVIDL